MSETTADASRGDLDLNLGLLNYGLLFFSIFFAGIPGLVAVAIAYSQRPVAEPLARGHYTWQIRIFWVALVLTVISAIAFTAAVAIGIGEAMHFSFHGSWTAWDIVAPSHDDIQVPREAVFWSVVGAGAATATVLWLLIAPLIGFIRLATQRAMSDRAA